ncbi:hypothetical protein [Acidithiobacillus ferriphilus]|uniref:hypothetical protein n=1 Tax=Acidithiobacillus ferriphilus TaxID=1689834 RepID=UPI00232DF55D|nr:hypothetical protein [Acidithiobacillus ferriphilus]WCE94244.1 hypothetical protein PJU76_01490 [Acidithiobacillus ferriphilus]
MIDTRSLYPFRNNLREYDENKGLLLELNNFTYDFLRQGSVSFAWNDFGKNVWMNLLMRPLQQKENTPSDFIFTVLEEIYNKNDLAHLYAYIELLYDSLAGLAKTFSIGLMSQPFANLDINFETGINDILYRFNTGLLLCSGNIIKGLDIVTQQQIGTVLEENDPASKNIRTALKAISINGPEDADLCIREAACAVEYTIKTRLNENTLLDGTKKLKGAKVNNVGQAIHGALLKSLERLYAYTSDTARHSATKPLTIEEAQLTLSLSAAWVNYLRKVLPEPPRMDGNP